MKSLEYLNQPELGKTARELRKKYNITQEEFAESIGVTRQTIINFESGSTQSMEVLQAYLRLWSENESGVTEYEDRTTIET